jgi:hypothetical protein
MGYTPVFAKDIKNVRAPQEIPGCHPITPIAYFSQTSAGGCLASKVISR